MPASENSYIAEASDTMFQFSAEENIWKRCQDREEYYREIRTYKKIIAKKILFSPNRKCSFKNFLPNEFKPFYLDIKTKD